MEDPLMNVRQTGDHRSFSVQDQKPVRAAASLSGSRCLVGLLVLNLLVSSTMLVGFFVFASALQSQVKEMGETMNPLTQLGLLWRTNTDLSTWKGALSTVSSLADQVKSVDWAVQESWKTYGPANCDSYPMSQDKATCESFVGDDGKKCTWFQDDYFCNGTATQKSYESTNTISVRERDSQSVQNFLAQLKDGLDVVVAKLPTLDETKKQAVASNTNQVCASTPASLEVKEHSFLNVPLLADTTVKDFPCFAHQTADQGHLITEDAVSSVISGLVKMRVLYCDISPEGPGPSCDNLEKSIKNTVMAYRNFVLDMINKYTAAAAQA